jgi:hypothetical protein
MNPLNSRKWWVLTGGSAVSAIAAFPYLTDTILKDQPLPVSLPVIMVTSFIQSFILFGLMTWAGLVLSQRNRFETDIPGLPGNEGTAAKSRSYTTAPFYGLLAALLIVICDFIFYKSGSDLSLFTVPHPVWWKGFLASFYGGIAEEVTLRLFVMNVLVWLFSFMVSGKNRAEDLIIWSGILISAVLFGVLHLPATSMVADLEMLIVVRALLLNTIAGVLFGWLFWKNGLGSAMIAHFSADIFLHVLFPFFL